MLKNFWEKKKHIIQFVGILIASGALFLSIPSPENKEALEALKNLQFLWVIIISVSAVGLMISLWELSGLFEKELKQKNIIDFDGSLTVIISFAIGFLIFNLWEYIISIYKDSFFNFIAWASWAIGSLLGALGYEFYRRVNLRFEKKSYWARSFFSIITIIIIALVIGAWLNFNFNKGIINFKGWILISVILFVILFCIPFLAKFFSWKKKYLDNFKKNTDQDGSI